MPEGWRAEIGDGRIPLIPPPPMGHHVIVGEVRRSLYGNLPDALGVHQTLSVHVASLGRLYVPFDVTLDTEAFPH